MCLAPVLRRHPGERAMIASMRVPVPGLQRLQFRPGSAALRDALALDDDDDGDDDDDDEIAMERALAPSPK